MGSTQVPIGLNKQDQGDQDWHGPLNAGIDAANTRLTLSGVQEPGGVVAGYWIGQLYTQIVDGKDYILWICRNATGNPLSSSWRKVGVQWDASANRLSWFYGDGNYTSYLPGKTVLDYQTYGTVEATHVGLISSPVAHINIPSNARPDEYCIFVEGTVELNSDNREVSIQQKIDTGNWTTVTPKFNIRSDRPVSLFYRYLVAHPYAGTPMPFWFRFGSDEATDLVGATLRVTAHSLFGGIP